MIIWGSKGKKKTIDTGQFFCPRCGTLRPYQHKKLSKYFTLYFIPLFETKSIGEYIECQVCFTPFRTEVLQYTQKLEQEKQQQQKISEIIKEISNKLDSGIPLQALATSLKNSGINEDATTAAIYAATKGKIKVCEKCGAAFTSTLIYCSTCGAPLKATT